MAKRTNPRARKRKGVSSIKATTAAASGAQRAAHFAAGGTVAAWRGRSKRIDQTPKVASRNACRGYRG